MPCADPRFRGICRGAKPNNGCTRAAAVSFAGSTAADHIGAILMGWSAGNSSQGGVIFHHAGAFWFGALATTVGVVLHLPMYIGARDMGYRLVGMPVDTSMIIGMFLIVLGLFATLYGLYPASAGASAGLVSQIRVTALDEAPIRASHIGLLVVMAIAVTIDVMKPTTLAFVVPGMAQEYGLRSPLN